MRMPFVVRYVVALCLDKLADILERKAKLLERVAVWLEKKYEKNDFM